MTVFRTAVGALLLCAVVACASTAAPDRQDHPAAVSMVPAQADMSPPADAMPSAEPAPTVEAAVAPVAPAAAPAPKPAKLKPKPIAKASAPMPAPIAKPDPVKAVGQQLAGKLELVAGGRDGVAAGEVAEGLVYFLPKAGNPPPKPGTFTVDTRSKGFSPAVLVVPVGSTIRFPNRDTILHNVFSRTPGSVFDFGYYGSGDVKQRVFSRPGLVIVNCNVHHNMRADIVVLATPYYTRPDRSGRYRLDGLPAGPGTLVFWHPRADAQSVAVTMPAAAAVNRKLAAVRASRQADMAGH